MSAGYMRRCAGKVRCETKSEANAKRAALRAEHRLPVGALDVYRCDQCLGWHVGGSSNAFITRRRRSGRRPNKRMRGRV
jgi:hypothetical protein